MITTIQLDEKVKKILDKLKEFPRQTYEEVISTLIMQVEQYKRKREELMIEGAKATGEESIKITGEYEKIEDIKEWEW